MARAFRRRFTIHTAQHSHVNTLEAPNVRSVGTHDMSTIQQSADDRRIHHLKLAPCTASIAPKDSVRNWAAPRAALDLCIASAPKLSLSCMQLPKVFVSNHNLQVHNRTTITAQLAEDNARPSPMQPNHALGLSRFPVEVQSKIGKHIDQTIKHDRDPGN